jgi:DNA primase
MGKLIKFEYVNEHGDFEKVLSHFAIDYTKKGKQLRALCPFHEDSNPSLSVTLEADGDTKPNTFHCFGCNTSGSIIDFTAQMTGDSLRDGAELVAELSGCALAPQSSGKEKKKLTPGAEKPKKQRKTAKRTKTKKPATKDATDDPGGSDAQSEINPPLRFSLTLDETHAYVQERLQAPIAKMFGVGVCDPNGRSMMAGRCCVPIHNEAGALVAYAGRYLGDDPEEPKWLLPPGFEKMRVLYNAHRVWGSLHVVLVEGFFDAMHLQSLGIPAVACIGTAVSDAHVSLLRTIGARRVTVLFDGDDEGQAAAQAAVPVLARELFVRLGSLPVGSDPDETSEEHLIEQARAVW